MGMGTCFKPSVLSADLIFHALLTEAGFSTEIVFGQSAAFVVLLQREVPYFTGTEELQADVP